MSISGSYHVGLVAVVLKKLFSVVAFLLRFYVFLSFRFVLIEGMAGATGSSSRPPAKPTPPAEPPPPSLRYLARPRFLEVLQKTPLKPWQTVQHQNMKAHMDVQKDLDENSDDEAMADKINRVFKTPPEAKDSQYVAQFHRYKARFTRCISFVPTRMVSMIKGRPYLMLIMTHPGAPSYEYTSHQAVDLRPLIPVHAMGVTGRDPKMKVKKPQFSAVNWVKVSVFK